MNEVHATPKQGKTWVQVEKEYAKMLKQEKLRKESCKTLNSIYGVHSNIKIMDDVYVDTDTVRKNISKRWRILIVMDELEKNSFIKMFTEGWCSGCAFDSSKCAEQKECEAYKVISKLTNNEGEDNDGKETV